MVSPPPHPVSLCGGFTLLRGHVAVGGGPSRLHGPGVAGREEGWLVWKSHEWKEEKKLPQHIWAAVPCVLTFSPGWRSLEPVEQTLMGKYVLLLFARIGKEKWLKLWCGRTECTPAVIHMRETITAQQGCFLEMFFLYAFFMSIFCLGLFVNLR